MRDSPETRAVKMAQSDVQKVIESFGETQFMNNESPRTRAREERLANAPLDIQQLREQGLPLEIVDRLTRLVK